METTTPLSAAESAESAEAVPEDWRDAIRGFMQTACDALERTEFALYRHLGQTRDEQIGRFTRRFEQAADALIGLADELSPPDDDDDPSDDTDEAA